MSLSRFVPSGALTMLIFLMLWAAPPVSAVSSILWTMQTPEEFEAGKPEGIAVGSGGDLALTPELKLLNVPALDQSTEPFLWSQAVDSRGTLFVGGGRTGGIFRIPSGGTGSLYFETGDLAVHALAIDRSDTLFAGTSPDGRIFRISGEGKGEVYYDPEDRYIWSLVSTGKGELYAATGERGIIYRIRGQGKAETFFDSEEFHVVSLALDHAGNLLAGTDGKGLLYRIDPAGKATVLYDSALREINAIATNGDGGIYAAAIGGSGEPTLPALDDPRMDRAGRDQAPAAISSQSPVPIPGIDSGTTARVTVTAPADGAAAVAPLPRSEVYRIAPDGTVVVLWSSQTEVVYSLALDQGGRPIIGTGEPGRIRALAGPRESTLLARLPQSQVTSLAAAPGQRLFAASSNVGRIYLLDAAGSDAGSYVSPPRDALTLARWGQISWRASLPSGGRVNLATRSGNSSVPDPTWSDWSTPYTNPEGSPIASPTARFLQWRARLARQTGGNSPTLHAVSVAYVQSNLPPLVTQLTVQPPGVIRERIPYAPEIDPADLAFTGIRIGPDRRPSNGGDASLAHRKIYVRGMRAIEWTAEDPNQDALAFNLSFRGDSETAWKPLARKLRDSYFDFDSMQLPDGLYRVRLEATDGPSNPGDRGASVQKESESFLIDNTPPSVTLGLRTGGSKGGSIALEGNATDTMGPIAQAEYSVDATGWVGVPPADGVSDSRAESYSFTLTSLPPGEHTVILKVLDLLGNTGAGKATFMSE